MKRTVRLAGLGAAAFLVATLWQGAVAAPPGPPPQGAMVPRILLVDRAEVLSRSAVGQSIMGQVRQLIASAQAGLKAREIALQKEGQALQQQLAILSPSVKDAKVRAFRTKQEALQVDLQKQQGLIQGGLLAARTQALSALKPVLQKIIVERGGNLLIDRNAALEWLPAFDVTPEAIARLNQAITTVKVVPQPMPENAGPQQ
ncbi:MAG: OmpH family outer membrane protein [Bryobacteraceae bacterium]